VPDIFSAIDVNFPRFDGGESIDDKVFRISDYLYMLVGELGHTLRNLDFGKNMNNSAVGKIHALIDGPINLKLENKDKGLSMSFDLTADGLDLLVSNDKYDLTRFTVRADGIVSSVTNVAGDSSSARQNAGGFSWFVDSRGSSSSFTLSDDMASLDVGSSSFSLSDNMASLDVGASRFTLSDGKASLYVGSSSFTLTGDSASLVANRLSFDGVITFTNIKAVQTKSVISGGTVTCATLQSISNTTAVLVNNGRMEVYTGGESSPGKLAGGLCYDTEGNSSAGDSRNRLFLYTNSGTALKIQTFGANMSIEAEGGWVYAMGNWSFHSATVVGLPEPEPVIVVDPEGGKK